MKMFKLLLTALVVGCLSSAATAREDSQNPSKHVSSAQGETLKVAILAKMEAKPGKEADVEAFLKSALPAANKEAGTKIWFALKLGPSTFGIFDAFPDDAARQAHLSGSIASALMAKAPELFLAGSPVIEKIDVLAAKVAH